VYLDKDRRSHTGTEADVLYRYVQLGDVLWTDRRGGISWQRLRRLRRAPEKESVIRYRHLDRCTYMHVRLMAKWSVNVQLVVSASNGQSRSSVLTSGRAQRFEKSSQ